MDFPVDILGSSTVQPVDAAAPADDTNTPHVISDSGSSTEVDEDDDNTEERHRVPVRLPAAWAFSQRAVGATAVTNSGTQSAPIRRRLR